MTVVPTPEIAAFQHCFSVLKDGIKHSLVDLVPELFAKELITDSNRDKALRPYETPDERACALLSVLQSRFQTDPPSFSAFLQVLESFPALQYIGKKIREAISDAQKASVPREDIAHWKEILRIGGVPSQKSIYVDRRDLTEKICKELHKLKDGYGCLLLHGMGGCGKTTLAAEIVRDAEILSKLFPGGIFWLTVGQLSDGTGKADRVQLLTKVQNFILRLDKDRYRPTNLEEATDYLKKVLTEQHPHSLLILDDVWSPDVAKTFDVSWPTIITSRNQDVISGVSTSIKYLFSISEGFSEDEGRNILCQWSRTDPANLPSCVTIILKYCRGSPLALSLIGARLRKDTRESNWKAVAEKLAKDHVGAIRKTRTDVDLDYKHPAVNVSITMSVQSLSDDLRELFQTFAVLEYDIMISSQALNTIWGLDDFETRDCMEELIATSLVQRGPQDSDFVFFFIHDLIMDYLHDTVSKQQQIELHKKIVKCYSKKCDGKFSSLPADNYVHKMLVSHVEASGDTDLLGELLSSLDWLVATTKYMDVFLFLRNLRMYKSDVSKQFFSKVEQFESFVGNHIDHLAHMLHSEDIVQLALFQPDTSEVHQQAAVIACSDCKKPWLKWSNKAVDSESTKYALQVKMHDKAIRHCQYSQDGSHVVSCSSDKTVKLWDSSTGKVLQEFKGHEYWVMCCALSRSGSFLVSSSLDYTVKVWEVHSKQLLVDFTQHNDCVSCCDLSPNEELVISGDAESYVMVWEARTGEVKAKWLTPGSGNQGVYSCAFSPSGDYILTGSDRGAMMLWALNGDVVVQYKGHSDFISSVAFNHDGVQMASTSTDQTAKIWDMDKSDCVHILPHNAYVESCDFSPNGSQLVTGDQSRHVKIWSVKEGDLLHYLIVDSTIVTCVCYSPCGQHILMANHQGLIKILRSSERDGQQSLSVQYWTEFSVCFQAVGMKYEAIIVCQNMENAKLEVIYGSGTTAVIATIPTLEGHSPVSWQISNTGTMVVVGHEDGTLQLISLTHNEDKWEVKELWQREDAHTERVKGCYFSPDDSKIISCTEIEHKSWSTASWKNLAVIRVVHRHRFFSLCAFFNDSIRVVSARERSISIWSSVTGDEEQLLSCEDMCSDEVLRNIDLSQDNSKLIAVVEGEAMVWDTESWKVLLKVKLEFYFPTCALSPDGSHAVISSGSELQIWSISEARKKHKVTFTATTCSKIRRIVFPYDSQEIVTLSGDKIDWWKIDGSHMKTVFLKTKCVHMEISPNYDIVTVDKSGLLYILNSFAP